MKLGLFMMPLHDPQRDYTQVLQEDREGLCHVAKRVTQKGCVS